MNASDDADHRRAFVLKRIKVRLPALESELFWAAGLPVPPELRAPPEWVRGAIKRVQGYLWPLGIVRTQLEEIPPRDRGAIEALLSASDAALRCPSPKELEEEERIPQLRELRELFLKWIEEVTPKYAEACRKAGLQLETPKAVEDFYAGGRDAAKFVADEAGADMTMSGDLCFWMWMLWPDISASTRPELHRWVTVEMKFISCSFKLVEKVCREIGFPVPDPQV